MIIKGWDGSYNGVQFQDGAYVCHLQFYNGAGSLIEKKDVVTIIRRLFKYYINSPFQGLFCYKLLISQKNYFILL